MTAVVCVGRSLPPKKQPGQGKGPRTLNGAVLDVRSAAGLLGTTEKTVRRLVDRRALPFRRLNSRIIFLRAELETFLAALPGCSAKEARENIEMRHA
jgi:excisionase family DNA binding protein